jgi:hypothetical protein
MNMVKGLVMMITFGLAGVALAEGGADRTFARMETARQSSMQAYQIAQQKKDTVPVAAKHRETKHENC